MFTSDHWMECPRFSGCTAGFSLENRLFTGERHSGIDSLAVRLKAARIKAKLSKEALAVRLGIHHATVFRYECEIIRTIDKGMLKKWAVICNVPEKWLLLGGPSGDSELDRSVESFARSRLGFPVPFVFVNGHWV